MTGFHHFRINSLYLCAMGSRGSAGRQGCIAARTGLPVISGDFGGSLKLAADGGCVIRWAGSPSKG